MARVSRKFPRSNENRKMLSNKFSSSPLSSRPSAVLRLYKRLAREQGSESVMAEEFVSDMLRFAPEWRNLRKQMQIGHFDGTKECNR